MMKLRILSLLLVVLAVHSCKKETNYYTNVTDTVTVIKTDTLVKDSIVRDTIGWPLPASLDSGLVLWLPFSGNAKDSTSNHNNFNISGATLTQDRFGVANKAYYFDGVNDYMFLPYNASMHLTGDFTIAMWMSPDYTTVGYGSKTMVYIYDDSTVSGHDPVFMEYNVSTFGASIGTDRGDGTVANVAETPSTTYYRNVWTHVTGSWNTATHTLKIYANGILVNSQIFSTYSLDYSSTPTSHFATYLGTIGARGYVFYKGSMDEVRAYNRTLTDSEVASLALY